MIKYLHYLRLFFKNTQYGRSNAYTIGLIHNSKGKDVHDQLTITLNDIHN